MAERPRVLLVGAGAVGQVYARALRAAGCDVSFLVKEKYAGEARSGFTLYPLGSRERVPAPEPLSGCGVLVSVDEVARQHWDQVWLCVSSTALREGDEWAALARATGEATWVMLQPALDDRDQVLRWVPAERLVSGMIPFLSYRAPLKPGEPFPRPGTAFWFPPLQKGLFSGPPGRLEAVLHALKAGGFPARRTPEVMRAVAPATAVLTVAVTGLESVGWSFERFLRPDSLERVVRAAREAVRVAAWRTQAPAFPVLSLLRPALLRGLLPVASRVVPFDLETYVAVHFTKVSAQTRQMMRTYVELGQSGGLPVESLQALAAGPRAP